MHTMVKEWTLSFVLDSEGVRTRENKGCTTKVKGKTWSSQLTKYRGFITQYERKGVIDFKCRKDLKKDILNSVQLMVCGTSPDQVFLRLVKFSGYVDIQIGTQKFGKRVQ